MSYGQMRNHNITMVDDLPDVEDLERSGNYQGRIEQQIMNRPELQDDKYQKYIRSSYRMNSQSGMQGLNSPYDNPHFSMQQQAMQQPPVQQPPPYQDHYINCLDISRHIQDCPICSKFYSNDKTVYIIVIVLLSIICLLLLKRVLNV